VWGRVGLWIVLACALLMLALPSAAFASAPAADTIDAVSTGATTATVEGDVNPSGQPTMYAASYDRAGSTWCTSGGSSGAPANSTTPQTLGITDSTFHIVSAGLNGLTMGADYCVAITADNGSTASGLPPVTFTAGAPTADTQSVTLASATSVMVEGDVDPAGQTTTYAAGYDLASSTWCTSGGSSGAPANSTTPQTLGITDSTFHVVSVDLSGLSLGAKYCVAIVADNGSGAGSGLPPVPFKANVPAADSFAPVPGSPFSVPGMQPGPAAVAFSPGGGLLATADDLGSSLSVFSVPASGLLTPVTGSPFASGTGTSVAFSPGGGLLATASDDQNSVSVFSVNPLTGALTPVSGSPFPSGGGPDPISLAFSPGGGLLAVADGQRSVSVFSVDSTTGVLTPVSGSPFASSSAVFSVAFSPDGSLLAAANADDGTVSVLSVNSATDALTPVPGSPYATGSRPVAVAFSPDGELLATANSNDGTISAFSVAPATGELSELFGSPYAAASRTGTGGGPVAVAFSPDGSLLATANYADETASVFSVDSSARTLTAGPSLAIGRRPHSVVFGRGGDLLATADGSDGTVSLFSAVSARIVAPRPGGVYAAGQSVATSFACADLYGSGIKSCTDSNSAPSSPGHLDTTTPGPHSYTVTAVSHAGQTATTSVNYTIAAPPSATIAAPAGGGTYVQGQAVATSFACTDGTGGPGIKSCADTNGAPSPAGHLNTATVGPHTYAVAAASADSQTAIASISYVVVAAPATPPSAARIKSSMLREMTPRGKAAGIRALLGHHGYVLSFDALSAGQLVVDWYYLASGAHLATAQHKHKHGPKPVLVASAVAQLSQPGTLNDVKVALTTTGVHLLKHANHVKLTAQGTFTPAGEPAIVARKTFALRR
jgi:WD40 repeat protein